MEYLQHLTEQFIIWEFSFLFILGNQNKFCKEIGIRSFKFVAQTDREFQRRIKILDIGGVVRSGTIYYLEEDVEYFLYDPRW